MGPSASRRRPAPADTSSPPIRDGNDTLACAAFEADQAIPRPGPGARVGDRITACGEVSDGTLKLEKFAARDLVATERVAHLPRLRPVDEERRPGPGYRCRDCGISGVEKAERTLEQDLAVGWYEVPPLLRAGISPSP